MQLLQDPNDPLYPLDEVDAFAARLCRPGARSGLPCPVPACCCRGRLAAMTILLLHIISVRPSKQPLMVRTFLKVYMELGSYFLFLQEQIKDIIIMMLWTWLI